MTRSAVLLVLLACGGCTTTYPSGTVIDKSFEGTRVGYVVGGKGGVAVTPPSYALLVRSEDGDFVNVDVEVDYYARVHVGSRVTLACIGWLGCNLVR